MILRNVEVDAQTGLDVRLEGGRIAAIGPGLPRDSEEIDGGGGALIPGLADHHIHLYGLAAQAGSVDLNDARKASDVAARIAAAAAQRPPGAWIRAVGYHERMAGDLTREQLDALAPDHRLRVQHQTGALWVLNSAALAAVREGTPLPAFVEPSGRVWRGDAWLRERIGAEPPPLGAVGRRLAGYGITHLTDATVSTDAAAAARLADAHRAAELPQHLTLMSAGPLTAPEDRAFAVGPKKVLLDEHDLPPVEAFAGWIAEARQIGRATAVHCVTAAELALTLAAFEAASARHGDRIEHGGMIPAAAIGEIQRLRMAVVTQSIFIRDRGDRYAAEVSSDEQPDLYRCATLLAAGVPVAGSSDAPYGASDPWAAMATAVSRRTRGGRVIGPAEQVGPVSALALYLGEPADPGGPARRIAVGAAADLCLLKVPLAQALASPSAELVAATIVDGRRVWPA